VPGKVLTSEDLDRLGHASFRVAAPMEIVAELVAAVDEARLADPDDDVYALSLAAEISLKAGDLSGALRNAERAARLAEAAGQNGHARALYGELLLRAGREADGMAVLAELRESMLHDENAVYYVSEALEQGGRAEVAVQWLTAALETALQRRLAVANQRGTQVYQDAAVVAFALAQARQRLRRDLDLPVDDLDRLARQLRAAADEVVAGGETREHGLEGSAVLFWPREQFAALVVRWPGMAGVYGGTWDEHRARIEKGLHMLSESGEARLAVFDGDADDLAEYLASHGGEPTDPDVRQGYVDHRKDIDTVRRLWPPQRNQSCWCGSGLKYKKCCLPRSRP
jgi:tetratricopeptide (TPR) repeat protein